MMIYRNTPLQAEGVQHNIDKNTLDIYDCSKSTFTSITTLISNSVAILFIDKSYF
ncbi:MAG: hypothetical protein ACRYGR_01720 [Janthinobacterium lividum]